MLLSGCVPYKDLVNYNEPPTIPLTPQNITNFNPIVIQPDDVLNIQVSSADPLAVQPFVLGGTEAPGAAGSDQGASGMGYLVDAEGFVNFPTLGKVRMAGLTTRQANERLIELLNPYFEDTPIVNIRLVNFRVNISGEVKNPGSYNVPEERLTILEALVMAGDLSNYALRDSILVIREAGEQRSFGYVNLNSAEIFDSPYFYLHQNDVLYVRPHKSKRGAIRPPASNALPWVSAITSVVALIVALSR